MNKQDIHLIELDLTLKDNKGMFWLTEEELKKYYEMETCGLALTSDLLIKRFTECCVQNLLLKYMSFSLQSSPETETVSLKE